MCFGIEWGRLICKIIISQFVEVRMRTGGICPSPSGWWKIHSTSYSQGVAIGLYLFQPFRLMVGNEFAFYPRRCRWAKCVTAFQAEWCW